MDFTHYTDQCVQAAADLVNTVGSTSGNEYMGTPELVREFLQEHGFITGPASVTGSDVAELHRLRERLREVFFAPEEAAAADLLNKLLLEYEIEPYLTDHDGHWHFHYAPEAASWGRRVASSSVMALATVLAECGFSRFGTCHADDCADVFVDMSRNRSRRYCNDNCSTRTNVAAYRARAKAKTS